MKRAKFIGTVIQPLGLKGRLLYQAVDNEHYIPSDARVLRATPSSDNEVLGASEYGRVYSRHQPQGAEFVRLSQTGVEPVGVVVVDDSDPVRSREDLFEQHGAPNLVFLGVTEPTSHYDRLTVYEPCGGVPVTPVGDKVVLLSPSRPPAGTVVMDGLGDAYLGHGSNGVNVYSFEQILAVLIDDMGMGEEEAIEYACFNITGAWIGDNTPLIITEEPIYDELE